MQVRLYRNYKSTLWGEGGSRYQPLMRINQEQMMSVITNGNNSRILQPYDRLNASGSVGEIPLHADSQNMCRGSTAP